MCSGSHRANPGAHAAGTRQAKSPCPTYGPSAVSTGDPSGPAGSAPSRTPGGIANRPVDEVRDEDAHDERRLEALTQADEVVRNHGRLPGTTAQRTLRTAVKHA